MTKNKWTPQRRCRLCPKGPVFDRGPYKSSGNKTGSLEYHVQLTHPNRASNWEVLEVTLPRKPQPWYQKQLDAEAARKNAVNIGSRVVDTENPDDLADADTNANEEAEDNEAVEEVVVEGERKDTDSDALLKPSVTADTPSLSPPDTFASRSSPILQATPNHESARSADRRRSAASSHSTPKPVSTKTPKHVQVIGCTLCPQGPTFDRPGQGANQKKRSLERHVLETHPGHLGHWLDLLDRQGTRPAPWYQKFLDEETEKDAGHSDSHNETAQLSSSEASSDAGSGIELDAAAEQDVEDDSDDGESDTEVIDLSRILPVVSKKRKPEDQPLPETQLHNSKRSKKTTTSPSKAMPIIATATRYQPDNDDRDALNGQCGDVMRILAEAAFEKAHPVRNIIPSGTIVPTSYFYTPSRPAPKQDRAQQHQANRKMIMYLITKCRVFNGQSPLTDGKEGRDFGLMSFVLGLSDSYE